MAWEYRPRTSHRTQAQAAIIAKDNRTLAVVAVATAAAVIVAGTGAADTVAGTAVDTGVVTDAILPAD